MNLHWIWLSSLKLGTAKKIRLLRHFKSIDLLYHASCEDYMASGIVRESNLKSLNDKNLDGAEKIKEKCIKAGVQVLTIEDNAYPERLANIDDAPVVLYYKGTLPSFDKEPAIAVVGSRNHTIYGQMTAERLAYEMSICGAHIVSGMAKGIDAAAHRGALLADKPTTAVLGCGPDNIYPKVNKNIYEEICVRGCILSEYPPGTPPLSYHFPERNRIVSGLSVGVLVIEAGLKSGALITARLAADQGRDVFAVPGNIDAPESAGGNSLIQSGAKLVTRGWDVLSEFTELFPDSLVESINSLELAYTKTTGNPKPDRFEPILADRSGTREGSEGAVTDSPNNLDKIPKSLEYLKKDFTEQQMQIILSLAKRPMHLDQIIEECNLTAAQALAELTILEIKGAVTQLPGKRFSANSTI
jgi:DNA processing protein